MTVYFRMSEAFLDTPCAAAVGRPMGRGDRFQAERVLLYTRIAIAALSPSKAFRDAEALSTSMGVSIRQAQIVWDICVSHGMLRPDGYGYTARAWLRENNFTGRYTDKADQEYDKAATNAVKRRRDKEI